MKKSILLLLLSGSGFLGYSQSSGKYLPPATSGSQFVTSAVYDSAIWIRPDANTVIVSGSATVIVSKGNPFSVSLHFTLPFPVSGNPTYPVGGGSPITGFVVGAANLVDSTGLTYGAQIRFNPGHQPIMIWRPLYAGRQQLNYSYTYTIE